jgi:hypothetical protein
MAEFFWPSPEALEDLMVEDAEEGFTLIAPDDTECGEWLAYWNQSPEHIELFTEELTASLTSYIETINGKSKISDGINSDPVQTQDVSTGSQS